MNAAPGKIEVALFTVGFAIAGLVLLALMWSGVGPYADMARANGAERATFIDHATGASVELELGPLVEEHRVWSTYVTAQSRVSSKCSSSERYCVGSPVSRRVSNRYCRSS